MDIVFVKKYLQENLGFSDEKIDKILNTLIYC